MAILFPIFTPEHFRVFPNFQIVLFLSQLNLLKTDPE